jgi:hypothetical protein
MSNELDVKKVVLFTKNCLRSEGYSKELIAYLFSSYDLESFISTTNKNKLEIASHFLGHARALDVAANSY